MTWLHSLILFCYVYLCGVALSLGLGVSIRWFPAFLAATVAGAVSFFGFWARGRKTQSAENQRVTPAMALCLAAAGLCLGFARHLGVESREDPRISRALLVHGEAAMRPTPGLPEPSRLRVRLETRLEQDLRLRLKGTLNARMADADDSGAARMDARGRWRFYRAEIAQHSAVLFWPAGSPPGTEILVEEPFSRVDEMEILEGPPSARLALFRVSNHISTFVREAHESPSASILGRIAADPDTYTHRVGLPVEPEFLQYREGGHWYRVEGGRIEISIRSEMEQAYAEYAGSERYGADVQARGRILASASAANPGGFDQRKYLKNIGFFGRMELFAVPGRPAPIRTIAPEGQTPRRGNWVTRFSLDLRARLQDVILQTMPYPQSMFLGGVTLGLRQGLVGVTFHPRDLMGESSEEAGAAELLVEEFRASGVNHVLAVSGLHVTIISLLFVGLFRLMRLPRTLTALLVIAILVIFAILTGARPSSLRAVIMNSLFLITWATFDQGIRSSVLLGVPVAAFLILLHNPMLVTDPSFTLSFGAILSLALLTQPVHQVLSRLRGNAACVGLLALVLFLGAGILHWPLLSTSGFWAFSVVVLLAAWAAGRWVSRRGIEAFGGRGFGNLPEGVSTFIAAQFGIQIGMMLPLSAWYFNRWAMGGAVVNLAAIPLIGIVLQLAMLAGLIGMIPGVGLPIALLLNAANWIATSLFLLLAHWTTRIFPFPFVRRPSLGEVAAYYLAVALWVWWKPLMSRIRSLSKGPFRTWPAVLGIHSFQGLAIVLMATLLAMPLIWDRREKKGELRVTVLSAGYGSSTLIETPLGRRFLVDSGFVQTDAARFNAAQRTILPFLSYGQIRSLDGLILLSARPERVAGAGDILHECRVREVWLPRELEGISPDWTIENLAGRWGTTATNETFAGIHQSLMGSLPSRFHRSLSRALSERTPTWINRISGRVSHVRIADSGTLLHEEMAPGGMLRIESLRVAGSFASHPVENGSVLLKVTYGDFSMLFGGDLHLEGQQRILAESPEPLRADVLIVPHRGTATRSRSRDAGVAARAAWDEALGPFVKAVQPKQALMEFGSPRSVLGDRGRDARRAMEVSLSLLENRLGADHCKITERDGALVIESDGKQYRLSSVRGGGHAEPRPAGGRPIKQDVSAIRSAVPSDRGLPQIGMIHEKE
ncbi:MAG: ComEC/Rec2 family competence protein [Kiritimatiellia bacterium]|nr:ComEC/Rec2 family competence protein [Kiritimatiellia bacterium]